MTEPGYPPDDAGTDLRTSGEQIEALLEASSAGGIVARERAEELVRLVAELYGAGIERILDALYEADRLDEVALDALVADDLVSSLLLVHGLHPQSVTERVGGALDDVRPYLGSHGGDVDLIDISESGVVRLRLLGSCDGCASSAATLTLAVEGAIRDAAPEVTSIEVEEPTTGQGPQPVTFISTRSSPGASAGSPPETAGRWQKAPALDDLEPGELRSARIDGLDLVACRVGPELFAFRDRCPACADSLGLANVERRMGGPIGDAVLRCASCGAHYDVRRAGAGIERSDEHLDPLPLLVRDGGAEVALPRSVGA
jgi:Fe-S cluster biogenesis protein NfuA/nitrite reductase/ring-hydroxylating ferredoxin subunit